VSVIIVNYNSRPYIRKCIDSVLRSEYPYFEVIVVDNASTDGSFELVKKIFAGNKQLKFLPLDHNVGYAEGCNQGLKASNPLSEFLIFLNVDTQVDPKWIENLVLAAERNNSVGIVQCRLMQLCDSTKVDSSGGLVDTLGFAYRDLTSCEKSKSYIKEVFYADGAAFLIKRKVVEVLAIDGSLFDPCFFLYNEDVDLSWRAHLMGYKVVTAFSSIVYHCRGGTLSQRTSPMLTFHKTKNHIITLISNYSVKNLVKNLPLLLFLQIGRSLVLIFQNPDVGMSKLKSLMWVLRKLKYVYRRRTLIQSKRKISDNNIKFEKVNIWRILKITKFFKEY